MLHKPQIRSCTIEELYTVPTPTATTSIKAVQSTATTSLKSSTLTPQLNSSAILADSVAASSISAASKSFLQKNAVLISIAALAAIGVGFYLYKKRNEREKQQN